MTITKKLTGLFWSSSGTEPAARSAVPAPATPSNVVPIRAPAPPAGEPAALDAVVAAIYAKSPGEPKLDQILTAFESMKLSMPVAQVAIALSATVVALGVEEATLVSTIDGRARALTSVVAEEQRKAIERQTARTTERDATTAAVNTEIKAMESRVIALREQLATALDNLERRTAVERAQLAAFEQRAHVEASRLGGLRDVLATTARHARTK